MSTSAQRQRTYWHLSGRQRVPSRYEVCTSRLLYYPELGVGVRTPGAAWIERFQKQSPLQVPRGAFSDPSETTYASYVARQRDQEAFVDELFASSAERRQDERLDPSWLSTLEQVVPVLRFPGHGLQMLAAYVGCMAPDGRMVVTCALQAANEMRRVQRLAQRMAQLRALHPGFGEGAREQWQSGEAWQPLRAAIERLLSSYDFGEALVGLNLVLKPAFDELFMVHFARSADAAGDRLLAEMLRVLHRDDAWQREWTDAALRIVVEAEPENRRAMSDWVRRWWPPVADAVRALACRCPPGDDAVLASVTESCRSRAETLGVEGID